MIGFYCFTQPEVVPTPTVLEKIALLSAAQKTGLLNYFVMGRSVRDAAVELKINYRLVQHVYDTIDNIQQTAKAYMRGEVIVTPAVLDVDGNVVTPAVYNVPPTTQVALGTLLQPLFSDTFTAPQVTAIVNAMIKWCKYDGTGTFAFYASQIIL